MKLADESINLEENLFYGGDKFGRSTEHSHGDLLALIDLKRSRIRLHKDEFQGTINAMKRNKRLAGAAISVTAGFIILLIILFFVTAPSGAFGVFFRVLVLMGVCYLIYSEIMNIIKLLIHTQGMFMKYADNHHIIPANKAILYCAKVISSLNNSEQQVNEIEDTIKNNPDVDIDDLYNKLSAIDIEPKTIYETIL